MMAEQKRGPGRAARRRAFHEGAGGWHRWVPSEGGEADPALPRPSEAPWRLFQPLFGEECWLCGRRWWPGLGYWAHRDGCGPYCSDCKQRNEPPDRQ
jgi:hypothetical protein